MGYEKSDSAKPVESSSNVSDLDIVEGMTGVGTVTVVASGLVFVGEAVDFVFVVVVDIFGVFVVVFVVVVVFFFVVTSVTAVVADVVIVNGVVVVVFCVVANGVVDFVFLGVALGCSFEFAVLEVDATALSIGLDMDFALASFGVEFGFAFFTEYFDGLDLLNVCG